MKFLVFFSCALALASAGYPLYYAPQHYPLIDHNGVPVETPEVQEAKALHFAAHQAAHHGTPLIITGHHGVPNVGPDGRPIDTPEVQLARAAHFIAYNEAAIRNSYGGHYAAVAAGPIDTPEVQIAKAAHFAAHAEAKTRSHYRKRRAAQHYNGPYAQPVVGSNGVVQETPEVQAEKAKHFALVAQAQAQQPHGQQGPYNQGPYNQGPYNQGPYNPQYAQPQENFHYDGKYGYHLPVIGPNGVPVETPAVQAEKAKHLASYGGAPAHPYAGAPNYGQYHG